jgi:heme exporter protein A
VSFSVGSGELLTVTGRNGAGKSSLLRMIVGLVGTAKGSLTLEDGDSELTIAEQSHYLGHHDALKPSLSVAENLRFWAGFLGTAPVDIAVPLDAVGLGALADLPAAYLSAGQQRRLAIARLLAVKRPIWLLDEPTSSLDAAAQVRLADFMRGHLADGGLILAATHAALGLPSKELRLDNAPASPAVGDWGGEAGGLARASTIEHRLTTPTPTPNPSPQGAREQTKP